MTFVVLHMDDHRVQCVDCGSIANGEPSERKGGLEIVLPLEEIRLDSVRSIPLPGHLSRIIIVIGLVSLRIQCSPYRIID